MAAVTAPPLGRVQIVPFLTYAVLMLPSMVNPRLLLYAQATVSVSQIRVTVTLDGADNSVKLLRGVPLTVALTANVKEVYVFVLSGGRARLVT